jgi:hypothetical protein
MSIFRGIRSAIHNLEKVLGSGEYSGPLNVFVYRPSLRGA